MSLVLWASGFVVGCHIMLLHGPLFFTLVCICVGCNIWCQFLHLFSVSVTGGQVYCILSFSILVHPFLLGPYTKILPYGITLNVVFHWFHFDCIFLRVYMYVIDCSSVKFRFFRRLHWKHCRCIVECGYMVDSMGYWSVVILVLYVTLHYSSSVG